MRISERDDQFVAISDDGQEIGELNFHRINHNEIDAQTTQVDKAYRGQGVAEALLDALVEKAKEKGVTIYPTCSYVENKFNENPEKYADINSEA